MEDLCRKESRSFSKRQLFLQVIDILTEQGLLREDEKKRMQVLLTQLPDTE